MSEVQKQEVYKNIREALGAPFPEQDIEWRVQRVVKVGNAHKAIMLAYLTSRAVMQRLDDVFGVFGWQDEYERWGENGVKCTIWVRDPVNHEWVQKVDGADDTDIEATKGGFSNSLKRACVKLGIGRYLYNLDEAWCDILSSKPQGEHIYINDKRSGVRGYVAKPTLPSWALPGKEEPVEQEHILDLGKLKLNGGISSDSVRKALSEGTSSSASTSVKTELVEPKVEEKMAFDTQIRAIRKMVNILEVKGVQIDGEPVSLEHIIGDKDINALTFDEAVEAIKKGNDLISEALAS